MTTHQCQDFRWTPSHNEDGWQCIQCGRPVKGEPKGYSPILDKESILEKVDCIMHELHDSDFIYISNGSDGEVTARMVANRCINENRYDQYSIIRFLYDLQAPDHADYWRKIGMGIRRGKDPRDRCDKCTKLAMSWCGNVKLCQDHLAENL